MKHFFFLVICFFGSFSVLANVDDQGSFSEALKIAKDKKIPIGILLTTKKYDQIEPNSYENSPDRINDPYIDFARSKTAYVRFNKNANLTELPEFLQKKMKSYTEAQMPVLIFLDTEGSKILGTVTHDDNYSNVQYKCKTILTSFQMKEAQEKIAAEAIEVITTNHPIDAFNEKDSNSKIGTFETGSKLVVDKRPLVPGFYSVCFTNQDGTVINALCQKAEFN